MKVLEPFGTIYITSERPFEPQFEKYRIKINPLDMHHVMAFASLYMAIVKQWQRRLVCWEYRL